MSKFPPLRISRAKSRKQKGGYKSARNGRLGQVASRKQVETADDRGHGEQDGADRLGGDDAW